MSSQIGFVLVLADIAGNTNILHQTLIKCKRVTRSILASELYAIVYRFDTSTLIKSIIKRVLKINLLLVLCTDSKSLYNCLIRLGTTQEKRLMINMICLRQAYEQYKITKVKQIQGNTNPANSITKDKPSSALKQLIDTNIV